MQARPLVPRGSKKGWPEVGIWPSEFMTMTVPEGSGKATQSGRARPSPASHQGSTLASPYWARVAAEARRRAAAVLVLENGSPPIDKACGEGLLPEAVMSLAELGVDLGEVSSAGFRGIRFVEPGAPDIEAVFRNGVARGVRRRVLHEALIERA